jgi:5-methylcytosine-specific restriction endonuclease McrA
MKDKDMKDKDMKDKDMKDKDMKDKDMKDKDMKDKDMKDIPLKINEKNKLNKIPIKVKKDIEHMYKSESESESEILLINNKITRSKSVSADSIKKKKNISKNIKLLIWNKYIGEDIIKHKCLCCKKREIKNTDFHCGHVIPESKGGNETLENLRPICPNCNLGMGQTNMIDYVKRHELFIG